MFSSNLFVCTQGEQKEKYWRGVEPPSRPLLGSITLGKLWDDKIGHRDIKPALSDKGKEEAMVPIWGMIITNYTLRVVSCFIRF